MEEEITLEDELKNHFPDLNEPELIREILEYGQVQEVKAGTEIMRVGSYVKLMPMVLSGAIKVSREDYDGDELFLYYLYPGQTCAMSINCCLVEAPSEVRAIAEYDTRFIAIPSRLMDEWVSKYESWKRFVITTYSDRFQELLHAVDSIAFLNMDERLIKYLLHKSQAHGSKLLKVTHQEIAQDLHSSREVISRLLKTLEKRGKIKLGRNKIEIIKLL